MTNKLNPYHYPTEYTVACIPQDLCTDAYIWNLTVAWRGDDRWAVLHHSQCLGSDGTWEWEPLNSERTDEWKATHRFPLEEALRLAEEAAPKVCINNLTPADLMEKYG